MNETQSRINAVHEALAYAVADVEAELAPLRAVGDRDALDVVRCLKTADNYLIAALLYANDLPEGVRNPLQEVPSHD